MPDPTPQKARLPPRWFIRLGWITHRRLYRWTGGRLGLWRPKPGGWGTIRLTTIGRRTGVLWRGRDRLERHPLRARGRS